MTNMAKRRKEPIKCLQINLQHSRAATDNLMQIIATENIDIILVQEPYLYQEEIKGISRKYRTYSYGEGKRRAAVILAKNNIGALLITQYSDNDTVLLEIQHENGNFYAASIYMDYNATIDINFKRIEEIITFIKGAKLIIATDSNSRSTAWYDVTTNSRGRMMEDFVASNQLHILNEERTLTTFQSTRGESNIDLTIANNKMLANIWKWDILEEESASDHKIIKFNINFDKDEGNVLDNLEQRYSIKGNQLTRFYEKFQHIASEIFQISVRGGSKEDFDEEMNQNITENLDVQEFTIKLEEAIQKACKETSGCRNTVQQKAKGGPFHGGRTS